MKLYPVMKVSGVYFGMKHERPVAREQREHMLFLPGSENIGPFVTDYDFLNQLRIHNVIGAIPGHKLMAQMAPDARSNTVVAQMMTMPMCPFALFEREELAANEVLSVRIMNVDDEQAQVRRQHTRLRILEINMEPCRSTKYRWSFDRLEYLFEEVGEWRSVSAEETLPMLQQKVKYVWVRPVESSEFGRLLEAKMVEAPKPEEDGSA